MEDKLIIGYDKGDKDHSCLIVGRRKGRRNISNK